MDARASRLPRGLLVAALVYLALRRLRFGYMIYGASDPNVTPNLALLDAALHGGDALFPI